MNTMPGYLEADGFCYNPEPSLIVQKITSFIQPRTAIDVGAGAARNVSFLLGQNCDVTAVENGPESLVILRNLALEQPHLRIIESSLQDLSIDETFDAVLCNMVLHFLQKEEIPPAIEKLKNLTASNGIVCISTYIECPENILLPKNYTFRLAPGELKKYFKDWKTLYYIEDFPNIENLNTPINDGKGFKSARIIARKSRD